jgi:hypothetical protein
MLQTHLAEVKHQGELKLWHSEPWDLGSLLHATFCYKNSKTTKSLPHWVSCPSVPAKPQLCEGPLHPHPTGSPTSWSLLCPISVGNHWCLPSWAPLGPSSTVACRIPALPGSLPIRPLPWSQFCRHPPAPHTTGLPILGPPGHSSMWSRWISTQPAPPWRLQAPTVQAWWIAPPPSTCRAGPPQEGS